MLTAILEARANTLLIPVLRLNPMVWSPHQFSVFPPISCSPGCVNIARSGRWPPRWFLGTSGLGCWRWISKARDWRLQPSTAPYEFSEIKNNSILRLVRDTRVNHQRGQDHVRIHDAGKWTSWSNPRLAPLFSDKVHITYTRELLLQLPWKLRRYTSCSSLEYDHQLNTKELRLIWRLTTGKFISFVMY